MSKKNKNVILDTDIVIKMIRQSKSNKDLGKKINKYYKYLKQNK